MDSKWCWEPEVGLLAPDAVIYLDMPIEDAAKRGEFGGERYEKVGLHRCLAESSASMAEPDVNSQVEFQKEVQRKFKGLQTPEWAVLDARESIEELEGKIREIALTTVAAVEDTDFQKLQ